MSRGILIDALPLLSLGEGSVQRLHNLPWHRSLVRGVRDTWRCVWYMALPGGFQLPILYLQLQSPRELTCLHREPLSWAELEAAALDANPRCTAVLP